APSSRSPSGAGNVFSNTQSAVISAITPSTSWRLNASLNRRMTSSVALVAASDTALPPPWIVPDSGYHLPRDGHGPREPERRVRDHPRAQSRGARCAAVRRHPGFRRCPARVPRLAARGRDQERRGAHRVDAARLRLPRLRGGPPPRESPPL